MASRSGAEQRAAWARLPASVPFGRFATLAALAGALAATTIASRSAAADDTKRVCAQSAETGQRLRDEGKPLAARAQLLVCGRDVCPAVIRRHCGRWLEQIDASIPTVVILAHAGTEGRPVDVTDVAVAIDGIPALATLNGQPIQLEPGEHTLTYTRSGAAPIHARVLLVAGEKNRRLTVDFQGSDPRATAIGPPPARGSDSGSSGVERPTSIRPAAWVFAGLAVVAGGSFAYFGLTGKSDLDALRATCAGHCDASAVSAAWNKLIVADVSLGVGAVSVGLATWLFLTPRHADAAPKDGGNVASGLLVGPGAHGLELGWRGTF